MKNTDLKYFDLLKKAVAQTLKKSHVLTIDRIQEWKGQDIANLQDDLEIKVSGRLSEKWFYTHIKSETDKLPRIDMLNMLSKYCGYESWTDFSNQNNEAGFVSSSPTKEDVEKHQKKTLLLVVFAIGMMATLFGWLSSKNTFEFCFVDADRSEAITNIPVEVLLLSKVESPKLLRCDSNGCIKIQTAAESIKFVVKSAYYDTDTITRNISNNQNGETLRLRTNDYAMMIHIFSKSKIEDWKRRRMQLDLMISEDAQIYQIYEGTDIGMDLYSKWDFINKMTMPLKSLKNIEILTTSYKDDQIAIMRFTQKSEG